MTPTHFLSAKAEPSVNPSGAEETFRSAEELLFKNVRYGCKNHQNDVQLATESSKCISKDIFFSYFPPISSSFPSTSTTAGTSEKVETQTTNRMTATAGTPDISSGASNREEFNSISATAIEKTSIASAPQP
jgi:hypothetical protein